MLRYERYLFYVFLLLSVSIILMPRYYITGDGASHTYNARILFDMVFNRDRDFYSGFFQINRNLDPNWCSHLLLGTLLQLMPAWLADKSVQLICIVAMALGFRYLIRSVRTENSFLSLLFYPFSFTLAFQEGFYNYSLGLAFFCFTIGYLIRHRHESDHPVVQLRLSLLLLLTALSHGMPLTYALLFILLLWVHVYFRFLIPFDIRRFSVYAAQWILVMLPSVLILFLFLLKRGMHREPHAWSWGEKGVQFLQFFGSQSTRHIEKFPAMASGLLILTFLVYALLINPKHTKEKHRLPVWIFLFMAVFTLISYFTCPQSIGGAGSIDLRLVFLPPFFVILFLATRNWNELMRWMYILSCFFITLSFLLIRFPYVLKAGKIGNEIMEAAPYIKNRSVVLNLHFDYWQKLARGGQLFEKDGSFLHFSDFLGAEKNKHLILLNNYEAEINYFPVNWQPGINPRTSIAGMIQGTLPPCGDYHAYEKQTGKKIDYILCQNWDASLAKHPCVVSLMQQIQQEFTCVFDSRHHAIKVYKRK